MLENIFKKGFIYECIISTRNDNKTFNFAPFGVYFHKNFVYLKMYKWSNTLKNILREKCFLINIINDGLLFLKTLLNDFRDIEYVVSKNIKLPIIKNCSAYFECTLDTIREYKDHYFLRGKIVNYMIYEKCFINRGYNYCIEIAIKISRGNFNIHKELEIIRKTTSYDFYRKIKNLIFKIRNK